MRPFFAVILPLLLAGCTTTPSAPKVIITNAGRQALTKLEVKTGAQRLALISSLPGQGSESIDSLPASMQLSWVAPDGTPHQHDTALQTHLPRNFRSNVYVQIEADQKVRIMLGASTNKTESDIPWSKPESWEGVPSIPGLNGN
jgi:hypothetical protein